MYISLHPERLSEVAYRDAERGEKDKIGTKGK
jgi:hypothetical protein